MSDILGPNSDRPTMQIAPPRPRIPESPDLRYLRQIRNAVVIIAVIMVLGVILSVVDGFLIHGILDGINGTLSNLPNG